MSAVQEFSGYLPTLHFGSFFGPSFSLPTYFVMISLDFCLCLVWLVRRTEAHNQKNQLSRNTALDLGLALMLGGFLGSRFFHVFFEEPAYYWQDPWRVLQIWRGGFVWYGGALVGSACFVLLALRRRLPLKMWLDIFAPIAALGYGFGRIACVFEGCCFGDVCELASGARFRYPTQMFAVVWEFAVLFVLLRIERRGAASAPGRLFATWLVMHAMGRILMESFRADPRGPEPLGLSLSTWISALILAAAAAWLYRGRARRNSSVT